MKKKKFKSTPKPTPVQSSQPLAPGELVIPWLPQNWVKIAAIYFVSVLGIYISTMSSSIAGGDAGELMGAAATGGVAHPPGFPFYMILAKIFTYLPFGTIAWRVNLLSALAAAGTATLIVLIVWRWSKNLWAGIVAASLFAFSPVVWTYAVEAEIFSLNNFFVALILFLSLEWWQRPTLKMSYLMALIIGFTWANHHIIVFYTIPLIVWMTWRNRAVYLKPKPLLIFSALISVGMLCYIQIPLATANKSLITWGDASTWEGFLTHFFRKEYGTFQLATTHEGEGSNIPLISFLMFKNLLLSTLYLGIALIPVGFYSAWKQPKQKSFIRFWAFAIVFYFLVFWSLSNMRLDVAAHVVMQMRFWQQGYVVLFSCLGLGLAYLLLRLPEQFKKTVLPGSLALIAVQIGINYQSHNHRENYVFETFAKNLLDTLPPNSMVISQGDHMTNPIRFVQNVLGYRTDVRTIDVELLKTNWYLPVVKSHYPDLKYPANRVATDIDPNGFRLHQLFAANSDRMIFICTTGGPLDPTLEQFFVIRPWGFCDWMAPKGAENDRRWIEVTRKIIQTKGQYHFAKYGKDTWENMVQVHYWKSLGAFSIAQLKQGIDGKDFDRIKESAHLLETLVAENQIADAAAFQNLGTAYFQLTQVDPSYRPKMIASWQRYLQLASPQDPNRAQIQQLVATGGMRVITADDLKRLPAANQPAPNPPKSGSK